MPMGKDALGKAFRQWCPQHKHKVVKVERFTLGGLLGLENWKPGGKATGALSREGLSVWECAPHFQAVGSPRWVLRQVLLQRGETF